MTIVLAVLGWVLVGVCGWIDKSLYSHGGYPAQLAFAPVLFGVTLLALAATIHAAEKN
jgi:hypothetical protein